MSVMDFTDAKIPDDSPPGEGMLTCDVCGTTFEHTGRGRKPKTCPEHRGKTTATASSSSSRRTVSKDVESAIAVLDGAYSAGQLGLMMFSPNAAVAWTNSIPELQKQNRVTLAGDPNLCKSICRMGERTGKAAFFLSHVMAVIPVALVLREDFIEARKNRPAKVKTPAPGYSEPQYDAEDFAHVPETDDDAALRFFG